VGKLCGWGNTSAYNAFDALLLGGLGVAILAWSRRRFGTWLPGAVTVLSLTTYYLQLDFSQVAQRDWHAAAFTALAMMSLEAAPRPWGYGLSILAQSFAFTIRPQVVTLLPGLLWAVRPTGIRTADRVGSLDRWAHLRLVTIWLFGLAIATGMLFLPLIRDDLLSDLARGLATVLPGSGYGYGTRKLSELGVIVQRVLAHARIWGLVAAIALVWPSTSESTRTSVIGWLLLLGGAVVYLAVTPVLRDYVLHPFWLFWAFLLGILALLLRDAGASSSRYRAVALILVLMVMNVGSIPEACSPARFVSAVEALERGRPVQQPPWGYQHPYGGSVVLFPWADYQATLAYLRTGLPPETRVANALQGIALNGPSGRLPAFPAESITWLFTVRPDDEEKFIATLRATPDSAVVWAPELTGPASASTRFPRLVQVIQELYEPAARFGAIAVWRRRVASGRPVSSSRQRAAPLEIPIRIPGTTYLIRGPRLGFPRQPS
jgi:hypothetical protein